MSASIPRVSIVLPAYNAAGTLHAALASITRQTFSDWECVVIDDGSTDGTSAIARRFARADARIHVMSTDHRGLVAALNEGLRHARADLVARMDADDVMRRDRLGAQMRVLERDPALAAVGCHVRLFPRDRMSARLHDYEQWLNGLTTPEEITRDAFVECPVAHPSLMMRRAMADLGYVDADWPEDYDLVLRALAAGMRLSVVPRRLLCWRARADSLSRTDARYSIERFTACKAHYLATGLLRPDDRYVLWGYGGTGRSLRRALAALGKTPSYIIEVKTSRLGQCIHGATVISTGDLPMVRGRPIVVSVARPGPRAAIRGFLERLGFVDGRDFVCAA